MTNTQVEFKCPECRRDRLLSRVSAHRIKVGRMSGVCRECRFRLRQIEAGRVTVTYRHRKFWLDRFTMDEIREMGGALDMLLNDHSRPAKPPRRTAA